MRNKFSKNPGTGQLRWVILLLVIVVILPTVCLLWFMTQAVKNERLVVRQKLIDNYTKRSQYFFIEITDLYFNGKIERLNSLTTQEPCWIFSLLAIPPDDPLAGMLIYGTDNNLVYPTLDAFLTQNDNQLIEPFQKELAGNLDEAIELYTEIAKETTSETIRYKANLSIARCLDKLDKKPEAIELAYKLSYPENPEALAPELAALVMRSRVFLAQLYKETNDENLYYHICRILGNSRYNQEKEDPYLPASPAETIIWQLDKLITIAGQAGLSDKLDRQINFAKSRTEAYQNSIGAADLYPNAKALENWPDQTIRKLSLESDMYGLKFKLFDKTILGIASAEKMLKILNAAVSDMQDDTISVQVYNNLGQLIAGDNNITNKPFLTLSPGRFFPDFKVAIHFKDNGVFENVAGKQAAIYKWTGILVALLILTSGAVAAQVIGRQIRLNKLKNDFIATVTHELKTPLASMRVLVDTLLEGNYNDQRQATEYLQLISRENIRLTRLIDNFLSFSRMERNKIAFDISPASPTEIANTAAVAMQTKFEKENVDFHLDIAPRLPMINADKDAMVTVLINLLDNACKYSYDNKQIGLRVFSKDNFVCFSVKDNGIGMTRKQMRKIFDRFYQADSSLSRRTEGTGLGLSIVKFIVDAHKGRIETESKPEKGSELKVIIPAYKG
jgi:signal transduction histidine kinase